MLNLILFLPYKFFLSHPSFKPPIHNFDSLYTQTHSTFTSQSNSGNRQKRCRDLIRQTCDSLDVLIVKGAVSSDHVHLHIDYTAKLSISEIKLHFHTSFLK